MKEKMKWINSAGGPYVIAGKSDAEKWQGVFGSSNKLQNSDYDKACTVSGHCGVIDGPFGNILIVSEPDDIAWYSISSDQGLLVRWIGADSDQQVFRAISEFKFEENYDFITYFDVREREMIVFEAALEYKNIGENFIKFTLDPMRYGIYRVRHKPDEKLWLELLYFRKTI